MSYKFKEVVEESIIYFYDHVLSCNEYTEDVFDELDRVYVQASKADEYEAENKELLEELNYLKTVNNDLVWQRDTDEEHESKAKAWDKYKAHMESHIDGEINEEELVSDLKSDYFESGEYNA